MLRLVHRLGRVFWSLDVDRLRERVQIQTENACLVGFTRMARMIYYLVVRTSSHGGARLGSGMAEFICDTDILVEIDPIFALPAIVPDPKPILVFDARTGPALCLKAKLGEH